MTGHLRRSIKVRALLLTASLCASSVMSAGVSADLGGSGTASTARITILYDAFGAMTAMRQDSGLPRLSKSVDGGFCSTRATILTSSLRTSERLASTSRSSISSSCRIVMATTWVA